MKYLISLVVVFTLGVFTEHNFELIARLQKKCPLPTAVDCNHCKACVEAKP